MILPRQELSQAISLSHSVSNRGSFLKGILTASSSRNKKRTFLEVAEFPAISLPVVKPFANPRHERPMSDKFGSCGFSAFNGGVAKRSWRTKFAGLLLGYGDKRHLAPLP